MTRLSEVARQRAIFVTGTDTEVGKSWVSFGLIRLLAAQGYSVVGMKPVASGCVAGADGYHNEDVQLLQQASTVVVSEKLVNPYQFRDPVAPQEAARREGKTINGQEILSCFEELSAQVDRVVVEGVGGWQVPLSDELDLPGLVTLLQIPVVMVVAVRLGSINHALLTAESVQNSSANLIGWVANRVGNDTDSQANLRDLTRLLPCPRLAVIPNLSSPGEVAEHLLNQEP